MRTLAALCFLNPLGRFPGLRVLSIENGSGWRRYLVSNLDKKTRRRAWGASARGSAAIRKGG